LLALITALSQVGIETTSLLALVGAAGLAIGLALKDTLSDLASGVILLILRPFDVGEAVDVDGKTGVVSRMNLFTVDITSFEGVPIVLPNSSVRGAPIQNFSRAQTRRIDLVVGVSYDADLKTAIEVLKGMVDAEPRVLKEPEAIINVDSLGDSDVRILVRYHCAAADFLGLKMDMTRGAKEKLEAAGISIPFPQREIKVVGGGKLSAA
jgi:small conductance mechanosensitive channel